MTAMAITPHELIREAPTAAPSAAVESEATSRPTPTPEPSDTALQAARARYPDKSEAQIRHGLTKTLELAEEARQQRAESERTTFERLVPLDTSWCDTPFPTDALPAWLRDFAIASARSSQVREDMAAVSLLGSIASITRGNVVVRVTDDYREPSVLWLALIASSGERKSGNQRLAFAPVTTIEESINAQLAERITQDRAQLENLNAQVDTARNTLKSRKLTSDERHQAVADLITAEERRSNFAPTTPIRLLADDATPEALATLLATNNGAISIASTEGNFFSIMTGRYGDNPFVEVALKAHAGDEIRIDRKGREPEYIRNPRLSLTLAVQPSVLMEIGKDKRLRGDGFIARFLMTYPRPMAGTRTFQSEPIPHVIKAGYERHLTQIAHDFIFLTEPHELVISTEGIEIIRELFARVETAIAPTGDLSHMQDWGSKLIGAVIRIAGLLHAAEHGHDGSRVISPETMANAVRIGEYFLAHAQVTYRVMSGTENGGDAQSIIDWAISKSLSRFSVYEARRAKGWDDDRTINALDTLVRHGYARVMHESEYHKPGAGRPPSQMLELNPDIPTGQEPK